MQRLRRNSTSDWVGLIYVAPVVDFADLEVLDIMKAEGSQDPAEFLLCSDCFRNQGLRLDALRLGKADQQVCNQCGSTTGAKLTGAQIISLAHRFFVVGSLHRTEYGGAPI